MKILKQSTRETPKVSLILLDWSVRESFHVLHYLSKQDVPRDTFEVIVIEYYSRASDAITKFEHQVDTWLLLEMPEDCYYHKHLMYNAGVVLAHGEICVICDSDAMVKEGFIRALIEEFETDRSIVLHLDQFRNMRHDFYPFNYPSFEDVVGKGCINNVGGKTVGVIDTEDPIHTRNYGACMGARREDLIAIGGADEHIDYLGHICGPYDMTFRLVNSGKREIWHQSEFMYHTWHPGQAGVDNYLGPHDGRHISTTSLAALASGRVPPLVENAAIRRLREEPGTRTDVALDLLIHPDNRVEWLRENVENDILHRRFDSGDLHVDTYRGFLVYKELDVYYAHLPLDSHRGRNAAKSYKVYVEARSLEGVRAEIDRVIPRGALLGLKFAKAFVLTWQGVYHLWRRSTGAVRRLIGAGDQSSGAIVRGTRNVGNLGDYLRRRFSQFFEEASLLTDTMDGLVQNLYFLGRDSTLRPNDVTVVVEGLRAVLYLKMLKVMSVVPDVHLVRVTTMPEVEQILVAARNRSGALVVLSRYLYWRCYPLIGARKLDDGLVIV